MTFIRLPFAEVGRLRSIDTTPNASAWIAEAEQFFFGGELGEFARRYGEDLALYAVDIEDQVVAVSVSYPDPRFHAVRIGSMVVDHRHRRKGFGQTLLQGVVTLAVERGDTICWLVSPPNVAMLECSRRINPKPDEGAMGDGYIMFVAP